jgi:hypothetical protein
MLTTMLGARETSRIGLGCGRLQGGAGAKAGIRLVEQARALGITHFDVAPSYGLGLAEDVLGAALEGDTGVTIATKVGIARPGNAGLKSAARRLLRPLLAATPALRQKLAGAAQGAPRGQFAPEQIEASVAESLRRLRRSSVDAVLLHQPEPGGIGPETKAAMQRLLDGGQARALGSGTGGDRSEVVSFGTVRQYRWSPLDPPSSDGTDIVHGLLRRYPRPADPSPRWIEGLRDLGFDASDPAAWPGFLLTLALASVPRAIVLISSNDPERLCQAVNAVNWSAVAGDKRLFLDAAVALIQPFA